MEDLKGNKTENRRMVYMDYSAGMPVDPRVVEAMKPCFTETFGNPSSLHYFGREAKEAMEASREKVAGLIGAGKNEEVIFTSGGTESNNLAIIGTALRNRDKGDHVIISAIEHISVLNICKALEKLGFRTTRVPVDENGILDIEKLKEAIDDRTVLISVMYANGEIGAIQPIKDIGEIASDSNVYLHSDAVAAGGRIPIDVEEENIDLLSLSSNDMYGPKGAGALYIKKGTKIQPVIYGGGQERGLRSGTENMPNIVGMAKAAELAGKEMEKEGKRLRGMRDRLIKGTLERIDESYLNGPKDRRLPNNANLRFSYIEGESLILNLDMMGIAAATGSACTSKTLEPSHVLIAIGLSHEEAHGSLQLTLGRLNNDEDVDYVLDVLPQVVDRLRAMSPLVPRDDK